MEPAGLFWLMLRASLLSTGGFGNLPSLHEDLIDRGWATDRQFAEALAVGQVSPGPNGLWVVSLGYLVSGLAGAVLALVAISLPPLLVLGVDRLYRRSGRHPAVRGFVRGLGLAVVGVSVVVLAGLVGATGLDAGVVLVAAGGVVLGLMRRVPVVVVLLLAAAAGVALY